MVGGCSVPGGHGQGPGAWAGCSRFLGVWSDSGGFAGRVAGWGRVTRRLRWRGADRSRHFRLKQTVEPPPAGAGPTCRSTWRGSAGPNHPRWRGADDLRLLAALPSPEPSPLARDEVFRALVDATIAEAAARDDVDLSLVSVDSSFIGRRRRNARALVAARWARRSSTTDPDAAPGPCAGEHTWANAEENRRSVIRLPTCVDDSSAPAVSWPSELRITRNAGRPHPFRFRAGF